MNYLRSLVIPLLIALAVFITSCTSIERNQGKTNMMPIKITSDIPYGHSPKQKLDLCEPQQGKGPYPGVLLIHGGAWRALDKKEMKQECIDYAARGFVVANMNYRLVNAWNPSTQWPAQLEDAKLALGWLKANSARLKIDPNQLGVHGSSAGAHLALLLGSSPQGPSSVAWVIDEFGPTDLTDFSPKNLLKKWVQDFLQGKSLQKAPALYKDASPIFQVTQASAPTLIVQGEEDDIVPLSQSQKLKEVLIKHNIKHSMVTYKGTHAFGGLTQIQINEIKEKELQFIYSCL